MVEAKKRYHSKGDSMYAHEFPNVYNNLTYGYQDWIDEAKEIGHQVWQKIQVIKAAAGGSKEDLEKWLGYSLDYDIKLVILDLDPMYPLPYSKVVQPRTPITEGERIIKIGMGDHEDWQKDMWRWVTAHEWVHMFLMIKEDDDATLLDHDDRPDEVIADTIASNVVPSITRADYYTHKGE